MSGVGEVPACLGGGSVWGRVCGILSTIRARGGKRGGGASACS